MDDEILLGKSTGSRSPKSKLRARCPNCNSWVSLRDTAEVWDLVDCPECNSLLEVVDLRPPTLDNATSDFDDDYDDDEEWGDDDYR